MRANHLTDVLCVREIKRSVDFIQNVHRRWLEEKQGQDERQRKKRALPSAEFRQTLLPHPTESHANLKPVKNGSWIAFTNGKLDMV